MIRDISVSTNAPEPATIILLGTGLAGIVATLQKRRKKREEYL